MAATASADLIPISDVQKEFLQPFLPNNSTTSSNVGAPVATEVNDDEETCPKRPFVTLTYACSLDSRIAITPGAQTKLSGPLSKSMTHYLRMHHDAILVGVNTVLADNPSLNCRYPGADFDHQPCPIVIDPEGRWSPLESKALRLFQTGQGKRPITISRKNGPAFPFPEQPSDLYEEIYLPSSWPVQGRRATKPLGTKLSWTHILQILYAKGIKSIMIEGGANIINQLLSEPWLVDSVIITIAPTFLGDEAVEVSPSSTTDPSTGRSVNAADLDNPAWQQFGNDMVLCGRLKRHSWSPIPSYNLPSDYFQQIAS